MFTLPAGVQSALGSRMTTPIRLFEIGGLPTLYFTDSDRDVAWNGKVWTAKGVSYNRIKKNLDLELDTFTVSIDNIDDTLIAWAQANKPTGYVTKAYKGYTLGTLDGNGRILLIDNYASLLFSGKTTSFKANDEMEFEVKSGLDLHRQRGLRVSQMVNCKWQGKGGFKGRNCGYTGPETECNRTLQRCRELDNEARFGGYPDLNHNENS